MRSTTFAFLAFTFLLFACASSQPDDIQVIGTPGELAVLSGDWLGSYNAPGTGRSGSVTFHLTANAERAYGDVLMVPKRDYVRDRDAHVPRSMVSSTAVLSIEFVRIASGEITGRMAPYADPEQPDAMLETHFTGRVDGDSIEGTFVTYSDHGVSPRRGTWRVHRQR